VRDKNVPEDCRTIFVGNLPFDTTEDDLGDRFRWCGKISNVRLAINWRNNKFKGFGYIEFEDQISVIKSLDMHEKDVKGRQIIVDYDTS
jgi:RNA recognition motif-containing protein